MSKKITLKLKEAPEHKINPFVENAMIRIASNKVTKRQFINGNKGVENLIVNYATGEIEGSSTFMKVIQVDEEKFAKLYIAELGAIWDLNKSAIRVLSYILTQLKPNSDSVFIDREECKEYCKYSSPNAVYDGLTGLIEAGIIARSTKNYLYFINPLVLFNGSRVSFARTYIKKQKDNPNQINLFGTEYPINEE
jgi:hypothetical protein